MTSGSDAVAPMLGGRPRRTLADFHAERMAPAVAALATPAPVLIPGPKGDTGNTGPTGAKGDAGTNGANGADATPASVYPVNSVYVTVSTDNPATTFGFGTWTELIGLIVGAHSWQRTA